MSHDDYPGLPKVQRTKERPYGFIDDPVDIARHIAMWRYDDIRAEPLPHWSDKRMLGVNLCNLIPFGKWTAYQNLADAYNDTVRLHRLDWGVQNHHTFALLVNDWPQRQSGELASITVPWHRMRSGVKGEAILISIGYGRVFDPNCIGNLDFRAEGGKVYGASAAPAREFDLRLALKRGDIERPTP